MKSGRILDLNLTEAVRNDQKDARESVQNVSKADLVIRDLGYFSGDVLETINQKEAFFLSRLSCNVYVYDEQGEALSQRKPGYGFASIYLFMLRNIRLTLSKACHPVLDAGSSFPSVIAGLTRNPPIKSATAGQGIPRQARDDRGEKGIASQAHNDNSSQNDAA